MDDIAFSSIRRIQGGSKSARGKLCVVLYSARQGIFSIDPVNASLVCAGTHVQLREAVRWNPARVLDDIAVHIDNPQGAVGPCARLHGTKPVVRRSEKLTIQLIRRPR